MSVRVSNYVWHELAARADAGEAVDVDNATELVVMLALADEADDWGGSCYPSLRTIARKCRMSEGGARKVVTRLEEAGLVTVIRPAQTGRGHHNRYEIPVPWADEKTAPSTVFDPGQVPAADLTEPDPKLPWNHAENEGSEGPPEGPDEKTAPSTPFSGETRTERGFEGEKRALTRTPGVRKPIDPAPLRSLTHAGAREPETDRTTTTPGPEATRALLDAEPDEPPVDLDPDRAAALRSRLRGAPVR